MGGKKGGKARANKLTATRDHAAAVAIWFMYYNFCRIHQTLRVTPAMGAGLSDHVWSTKELCTLLPNAISPATSIDKAIILKAVGR
jgi:hypothetical protein